MRLRNKTNENKDNQKERNWEMLVKKNKTLFGVQKLLNSRSTNDGNHVHKPNPLLLNFHFDFLRISIVDFVILEKLN